MTEPDPRGDIVSLSAPQICGEVWSLSAALHHLEITAPDGRRAKPFAEAPWQNDPVRHDTKIAAHLRHLGGEWPCLPFGATIHDSIVHGYATDNLWQLEKTSDHSVRAMMDLPGDRDLAKLVRTVTLDAHSVVIGLEVEARRNCVLPIGLHPIFAPPKADDWPISCRVERGETFPVLFERGASRLAVHQEFDDITRLPLGGWRHVCIADLFERQGEDAATLIGTDGAAILTDKSSGLITRFSWDKAVFPNVLLWISNKGRAQSPWNNSFSGLGFEPISARFIAHGNKGVQEGGTTFEVGKTFKTEYRFDFSWLEG